MLRLLRFVFIAVAVLISASFRPAYAKSGVLVSIKPIHSLVAAVMQGVGTPGLIVRGGASPHTYSLKPSDARALAHARIIFWIGEGLETFMVKPLEALGKNARIVELGEAAGLRKLPYRTGEDWEKHTHAHDSSAHGADRASEQQKRGKRDGHEDHDHAHGDGEIDMHLWMDPENAKAMVSSIVEALAETDPANASIYKANGSELRARLDALTTEITRELEPVKQKPFVVFHDAFQYFERRFGLNNVGSITVSPEIQPGAGHLLQMRAKILRLGAVCVFAEPQFPPKLINTVIEGTAAKSDVLDPVGADLPEGPEMYFDLLRRNARTLKSCLSASS